MRNHIVFLFMFIVSVSCLGCLQAHQHDHHHDHDHDQVDNPSFKYSRQANEQHHHGHSHEAAEEGHHGHSHGGDEDAHHGHTHGGFGHSHGEQMAHGHSHESTGQKYTQFPPPHYNDGVDDDDEVGLAPPFSVVSYALLSTLAISLAPVVVLLVLPVHNENSLKILLSFASGGLLGDAFLHLIPHAVSSYQTDGTGHGHTHSHSHSSSTAESGAHRHDLGVGLNVLAGIFFFLIAEKLVRHIKGHGHSHSHTHVSGISVEKTSNKKDKHSSDDEHKNEDIGTTDDNNKSKTKKTKEGSDEGLKSRKTTVTQPKSLTKEKQSVVSKKEHEHTNGTDENNIAVAYVYKYLNLDVVNEIKISGYLNLFADALHNFTDGLAIGSSYIAGQSVGLVTTFAVLLHEIPHEVGDYAILVQNGCSRKKAMLLQLLTAVGAFLGCLVGLLFHSTGADLFATQTFLPFTAGGFIYIATVSVIPELLKTNVGLKQSVYEIVALVVGVLIMIGVTFIE
ncbi:unnamed protein product [Didymodactylos carnosus]|uniref:Uncharacterized protein n=1 Tax=Didymodactylos carnosus TaxID=1234261 RepID=A0A813R9E0_9BILA|nr:unnamed protein product [Didymodactylos carnosus]CAF0780762.1 unnamed protein product [Didymodactylos carnosus]CAF3500020.1 unnamed protein product [Didymodactylos carnosus]CAF3563950.1 unnamed protein product [Didymodactylos carnosus]